MPELWYFWGYSSRDRIDEPERADDVLLVSPYFPLREYSCGDGFDILVLNNSESRRCS